jgi:hypothetical protein
LATAAIGFPAITSSATRNEKNWFQVDHARAIDAAEWPSANLAKACRRLRAVTSSRCRSSGSRSTTTASSPAMAAKSARQALSVWRDGLPERRAKRNSSK